MRKLTARGRLPCISTSIQSVPVVTEAPISRNFNNTASNKAGSVCVARIRPPVITAAAKYEPVSIRSGQTEYSHPCNSSTPCTIMRSVPAPSIFAPILMSIFAKSTTSGSRAAFSMMVVPSAKVAAIIAFSVPPTVTISKKIRPPRKRPSTLA